MKTWVGDWGYWVSFCILCRLCMLCQFWPFHLSVILLFFPFTKSWKGECLTYSHMNLLEKYYLMAAVTIAKMYFGIFLWIYIAAAVEEWWMCPRFHFLLCFSCTCLLPSLDTWHFMVSNVWFIKKKITLWNKIDHLICIVLSLKKS